MYCCYVFFFFVVFLGGWVGCEGPGWLAGSSTPTKDIHNVLHILIVFIDRLVGQLENGLKSQAWIYIWDISRTEYLNLAYKSMKFFQCSNLRRFVFRSGTHFFSDPDPNLDQSLISNNNCSDTELITPLTFFLQGPEPANCSLPHLGWVNCYVKMLPYRNPT